MDSAMSALVVSKWVARAGKDGSRILIGKKLISEMQVIRMNRERYCRLDSSLAVGGCEDLDIVFVFRRKARNRY